MSANRVPRDAGCYPMPSWEEAVNQSGGGFNDALHAASSLRAHLSHISPPAPLYWERTDQHRLSPHHQGIYMAALKVLGEALGTQSGTGTAGCPLKVLDVGGSYGAFYYELKRMCPQLRLDWTVVETPALCEMLERFSSDELRWRTEMPAGASFDLVFVSGTLPYLLDPYRDLAQWAKVSRRTCLSMLPLVEQNEDLVFLQYVNSDNTVSALPGRFFSRPRLISQLQSVGRIETFWEHPPHIPLRVGDVVPTYYTIVIGHDAQPAAARQSQAAEEEVPVTA